MNNELKSIIESGESQNLEFKQAQNQLPRSIWETYSAFANTDGGIILLGVKENTNESDFSKRFEITGIEKPEKILTDFWNTINSPEKVSFNLLMDRDVEVIKEGKKSIIKIHVPRATYQEKPVYLNGNPYSGTYIRTYEGDRRASLDLVKAMIRDSDEKGNDSKVLKGYTFDDIDTETLEKYHNEFKVTHPNHIWNNIDDQEFLIKIGGYAVDRQTQEEGLTAAGLLMFGKGLSIREYFNSLNLDYLDQSNLKPNQRWANRINIDGSWENNLYNFINIVSPNLTQNLNKPFILDGMKRIDDSPVREAIREALINMVIHSDYNLRGTIKIIKKDNAFFFSNPGSLKIPLEEVFHGGNSVARNPKIQKMLEHIGFGESTGSGFSTILKAWNDQNWRLPDLKYNEVLNQVELKLWTFPLISKELENELESLYQNSYSSFNQIQKEILLTTGLEDGTTKSRLRFLLETDNDEIDRNLDYLIKNDFIRTSKYQGETIYILNSKKIESEKRSNIQSEKRLPASIRYKNSDVNNSEEKILNYLEDHESITNNKVQEITNVTTRQGANKALNRLVDKGILEKRKIGKTNHFFLISN